MIEKRESPRSASEHHAAALSASDQPTIVRSSSFLTAGLRVFRSRRTITSNEAGINNSTYDGGRRVSNTSNTRRISAGTVSGDDEDGAMVLTLHSGARTQNQNQFGHDLRHQIEVDANAAASSGQGRKLRAWRRLQHCLASKSNDKSNSKSKTATTMYSISFYPWKMEAHGYYSHPEAAANWVPDTASARCQICIAAFSLTRRRHHCRLCGHLVCADCSRARTYLPFACGSRSQHRLIKDGAPQRTCSVCASTLSSMAAQDDPRVKRFTVAVASARRRKSTTSAMLASSTRSTIEVAVERPSQWRRRTGMALTDSDLEDEEFYRESANALQLASPRGTTHHFPLRLSVTRAEELDEILSARARSRQPTHSAGVNQRKRSTPSGCRQFVISSAWLAQWLQYVRVDPASEEAAGLDVSAVHLPDAAQSSGTRRRRAATKCRTSRPPRPGPVANYALLDFVNGELVAKPGLERSRGSHAGGDYRVVSQEVWVAFLQLYGGGPSIQMPLDSNEDPHCKDLVVGASRTRTAATSSTTSKWIITELDDSLPALAVSPPTEKPSEATKKGAAYAFQRHNTSSALQLPSWSNMDRSNPTERTHSTSSKRLTSSMSMSSLVKKTVDRFPLRRDQSRNNASDPSQTEEATRSTTSNELLRSSSRSRWKPWEEGASRVRAGTVLYDPMSDAVNTSTASSSTEKNSSNSESEDAAGGSDPLATIAAVSAFATAASLARKRSAMSLSRHSAAVSGQTNGSFLQTE